MTWARRAEAVPFDVIELDRLGELVTVAQDRLGGLDILVNNAGGSFPRAFLDTSVKMFERAFTFNVTTAFELTKQAVPAMLERGGGSVVNISSAAGRLPDRGFSAYGTAKAALTHLTREMARDLLARHPGERHRRGIGRDLSTGDGAHRRRDPHRHGVEHPARPARANRGRSRPGCCTSPHPPARS